VNVLAHDEKIVGRNEIELQRFGLAPSIAFGLGTPTQFTFSYLLQHEDNIPDYGLPFLFGTPAPVDRANFYGLVNEDYERTLLNVFTARLDHRFSDQLSLRNTLRYSRTEREAAVTTLSLVGTPTPSTPLSAITVSRGTRPARDTEEGILINQTELTARFVALGVKHIVSTGMEVAHETFDALRFTHANVPQANLRNPEVRPDTSRMTRTISARTDTTTTSFGIYAVDHIRLLPSLDLIGGLRWDLFDADFTSHLNNQKFERTDKEVSYRAGLVFHPTPMQSYYFSFGTSFNPSAEALALAMNNANTGPEENRNFEVGAKIGLFKDTVSLQGALFRLEKTNARTLDPATQLQVLEGAQRVQGFEVGIAGRLLPHWNLFAGYTYLDSKILESNDLQNNVPIEGKQLQNTPRHSASFWSTYDIGEQWQVGTGVFYLGERFANSSNTNRVPETIRWDATVAYQLNKHVQLRLNALNLPDALYYETVQSSRAVPGAGRTFILSGNFTY
jgi:catecholate siderophore receptor